MNFTLDSFDTEKDSKLNIINKESREKNKIKINKVNFWSNKSSLTFNQTPITNGKNKRKPIKESLGSNKEQKNFRRLKSITSYVSKEDDNIYKIHYFHHNHILY